MSDQVWRREYPFASHWIDVKPDAKGVGARLHCVDEGSPQAKNTILAVHGNPTWSFYYRSIVSGFRDTCRVVAVDHIGCGLSDKPQSYDYCLANHTKNLIQLIDERNLENVTLVVHDWGGAIGLGAAVERSERIRQIIVLNTGAFPPPYIPFRIGMCRWPLLGSFAVRYFNAFALAATVMAINRLPRLSAAAKAGLLAPYDSPKNRIAVARFVQDIPMSPSHRTYAVLESLEKQLPTLADKPIHFVWGMKDWCFRPECMERLAKAWPHSTRTELADVGHYVMEEASQEVCEELAKRLS
jgi:cis-3-alkyl-4-acyloxetan-2-one decarboxylase